MKKVLCGMLLAIVVSGCDRSATVPPQNDTAAPTPDNSAQAQSIMQPEVIAEVEPAPSPTPAAPEPVTGITIAFPGGTALDDAGRQQLDSLLAEPNLPAGATWVLRGSTDSSGSDSANLASSRRRAQAVRDYLVDRGIDAARISVIALGERRPIAPNAMLDGSDNPAGRARNRRVDIEIVPVADSDPAPVATPAPAPTSSESPSPAPTPR